MDYVIYCCTVTTNIGTMSQKCKDENISISPILLEKVVRNARRIKMQNNERRGGGAVRRLHFKLKIIL